MTGFKFSETRLLDLAHFMKHRLQLMPLLPPETEDDCTPNDKDQSSYTTYNTTDNGSCMIRRWNELWSITRRARLIDGCGSIGGSGRGC